MITWGVWLDDEVIVRCFDGPSAFREEESQRAVGWHRAQAVVSRDGGESWRFVPWESSVRPDPRPPRRASVRPANVRGWRGWRDRVFRGLGVGMRPDSEPVVGLWRRWLD